MSTDPSVSYTIKNELQLDKQKPPIANEDEFDDADDFEEEFTPLTNGIDDGFFTPRNDLPKRKESDKPFDEPDHASANPDRRLVPAGYYPQWPTYYPTDPVDSNIIPSLNLYQQKKSMAQGMLDLALLSANANQLRYVLDSNERNHYYYVSLSLIGSSLVLQVLVAIALVFKSRYNIDNAQDYANADRINNFIMIGILLITITNVVSSAFAPGPPA